jgi:hypothetical protein
MNEKQTISQMIWSLINSIEASKNNYDAVTLSEHIINLSCLYANLTAHIADKENAYQRKLGEELDKNKDIPYNKIELQVKRSQEYADLKKGMALEKSVVAIIRAGNKYIRIKENEQSVSRYQGI